MQNSLETKIESVPLNKAFIIIGIIFIALNLRPSLTAVGPLIGAIQSELAITSGTAGLLITLPLLAFAFFSPLTPLLSRRWGNERVILNGILVLLAGIVLRSFGHVAGLFIGTVLIGAGIAVSNVILPSLIKNYFPHQVGLLTSVYSTVMALSAGMASGLSAPLAFTLRFGWQYALLIWAALACFAIIIWLPFARRKPQGQQEATSRPASAGPLWRSALAWQVTAQH